MPRFEIRASFPLVAQHGGMNDGKSIFSQLIGFLPDCEFRSCVARYDGDRYTKKLFCWEQFLAMAFAQLAYWESLRDIEACLGAIGPKLYHMGIGSAVARSTLADANENRDWRIFADFAQVETREELLPVRPLCKVPCLRPDLRRQHRPRPARVVGN